MSLTMAGGNINLQLNEVLGVYTHEDSYSDHNAACPAGWKIAILMSYKSSYTLTYPYPIFNMGNNSISYTAFCVTSSSQSVITIGNISSANFSIIRQKATDSGYYNLADTIVFFA